MKDYYEILEVSRTASSEVIEKAYRILAKKYHPDRYNNGVSDYKFKQIQTAYEILSNPKMRREYDFQLKENKIKQDDKSINTSVEQITNSYSKAFRKFIYNEKHKSSSERIKDLKAFAITVLIMIVIIFICIKVPFIKKIFSIK